MAYLAYLAYKILLANKILLACVVLTLGLLRLDLLPVSFVVAP